MKKTILALLATAMHLAVIAQTNNYFGTSGTISGNVWSTNPAGPYNAPYVTTGGLILNFNNAGTATGASIATSSTINFNAPITWTIGGTIGTTGTSTVFNVANGIDIDLGTQAMSGTATASYTKNGAGSLATAGGAYGGGFTLNAGTLIARGTNAMGGNAATAIVNLNGGTVACNAGRDFTNKFLQININGDIQFGESSSVIALASSNGNMTFTAPMVLAGATRTITLGSSGQMTFGGVISGTANVIWAANANGGSGTFLLTAASTYTGNTTITGGNVRLNCTAGNTLATSGNVEVTGGTLRISTNQTLNNVTIGANGSLQVDAGATLTITGTLNNKGKITNNGVITAPNDAVVLQSDATATGYFAASTGTVTNRVLVKRFVEGGPSNGLPGKRAFRFLSHPFNAYTSLSQLTNQIDITGTGATSPATGANFTVTASNATSAFSYNPLLADNASNDAGWQAFTNSLPVDGNDANAWKVGQGIRVLVRGNKGQGLTGGAYTVNGTTLSLSGNVNMNTTIPVTLRTNSVLGTGWNLVGNPLPSPIEIKAKLKALRESNTGGANSNICAVAYVWNANKAGTARGGYDMIDLTETGNYILPMNGVVLVQTSLDNNAVLSFAEADKSTAAAANLFRNNGSNDLLQLQMEDLQGNVLDHTTFKNNKAASAGFESNDGGKLMNEHAIYSITSNQVKAAINSFCLDGEQSIPLGVYSSVPKTMLFKASSLNLPNGMAAFLQDKLLNSQLPIADASFTYSFNITNDAASQGNERFVLHFKKVPVLVAEPIASDMQLGPNPARDMVNIRFANETLTETSLLITDMSGRKAISQNLGKVQQVNASIGVGHLPAGAYMVQVVTATGAKQQKLIIQ